MQALADSCSQLLDQLESMDRPLPKPEPPGLYDKVPPSILQAIPRVKEPPRVPRPEPPAPPTLPDGYLTNPEGFALFQAKTEAYKLQLEIYRAQVQAYSSNLIERAKARGF